MDGEKNFGVVKEPRGFIKLLQVLLAILAFATTCGFSSIFKVAFHCNNGTTSTVIEFNLFYPFNNYSSIITNVPVCDSGVSKSPVYLYGDYSSNSQFYVFVGVITFLYCLAVLILYIFFNEAYYRDERIPKADFIIAIIICALWFIASIAWADGVSKLKTYTSKDGVYHYFTECEKIHTCTFSDAVYAGLNISLIFGFTNVALWASSLWFLWKETAWFQSRQGDQTGFGASSADGSNI